jgi:hypothetical protein
MIVQILGPNLPDQNKGAFHAHKNGCRDISKYLSTIERFAAAVTSRLEVATIIYPPGDFEWDGTIEQSKWYLGDIWFAPCTKDLPLMYVTLDPTATPPG